MASSNRTQTRFHGGEWSPFAQGRQDDPRYNTAMNKCVNGLPIEEGAWTRRSGSRFVIPTYQGKAAKVQPLAMEALASYSIEFTDSNLRFFHGGLPVVTNELNIVTTIDTANPALMTMSGVVNWVSGDEIVLIFANTDPSSSLTLRNRVLKVVPVALSSTGAWSGATTYATNDVVTFGGNTYVSIVGGNLNNSPDVSPTDWYLIIGTPAIAMHLYDALTGTAIDGSTIGFTGGTIYVLKLLRVTSPYTSGSWATTRVVQQEDNSFLLNKAFQPELLTITPNTGSPVFAAASLTPTYFSDGPYLDPINYSQATLGGLSGNVSVVFQFQDYSATTTYLKGDYVTSAGIDYISLSDVNTANTPASSPTKWEVVTLGTEVTGPDTTVIGLQNGDVGRHVRFLSQPLLYVATTTYVGGDFVLYNNTVYQAQVGSTGLQPDSHPDTWNIIPTGTRWVWGKITSVSGPTTCNVQLIGQPLLYSTAVLTWRLGVYSDAAGWPSAGTFHEGRLWLGGVIKNRFDASMTSTMPVGQGGLSVMSNPLLSFSPTLDDGTVADNCGISYTLNATQKNDILWFSPEDKGIVVGTLGGEWLIQASQLSDPLTPTSIQAKPVTKYGCANIEPRRTGIALVIVQKYLRRCLEFISDVFTGKYTAPNLNEFSKHVTKPGIAEIAYQEELAPILWARKTDGSFAGCTYRRTSTSITEVPAFVGWHRHDLGTGRTVDSLIVGPSADATLDTMTMVTTDGTTRWVEIMADLFEQDTSLYDGWFLDGGMVPSSMYEATVSSQLGVYFTGLWYRVGETLTVFAGGLDVGDFTVDAYGRVFVPYGDGVAPALIDYTAAGAGAYLFTAAYVAAVKSTGFVPRNGGIVEANGAEVVITTTTGTVPTTTTIQSYVPTNAFSGETLPTSQGSAVPNWSTGLVTFFSIGGAIGLRTFSLASGVQNVYNTWAVLVPDGTGSNLGCVDQNGNITVVTGASNFCPITVIKQSDLTFVSSTGTGSSGGSTGGVRFPGSLQAFGSATSAIGPFIAVAALANPAVDVVANGASTTQEFLFAEAGEAGLIAGVSSDQLFGFHAITHAAGSTNLVGYYGQFITIVNPTTAVFLGQTFTLDSKKGKKKFSPNHTDVFRGGNVGSVTQKLQRIGDITPQMIDPSWTVFTQEGGVVTDQIDLGTIAFFQDAVERIAQHYRGVSDSSAYNAGTTYAVDALITYAITGSNTNYYLSKVAGNVGNTPTNDPADTKWTVFAQSTAPTWAVGTTYAQYDIVVLAGVYYRSLVGSNVGNAPATSPTQWGVLNQGNASGDFVEALDGNIYQSRVNNNFNNTPDQFANPTYWNYSTTRQRHWIVKFAKTTNTILWKVPVNGVAAQDNMIASGSVAGVFIFVSPIHDSTGTGTFPVYFINTQSGAYYVGTLKGCTGPGFNQICNSGTYSVLITLATYTSTTTGAPIPLNSTATFVAAHGSGASTWCQLFFGSDITASPIPGSLTNLPVPTPVISMTASGAQFPCVIGSCYTSQGQILRAATEADIKSPVGPGLMKTRRNHYVGSLLQNTIGVSFGTDFTAGKMELAMLKDEFQKQMVPTASYSGVHRHPLKDGYSYDSMLAWTVTRPYPVNIASIGGFAKTQDV